jgi:general L-amino acid transport system permease protein
MTIEAVDTQPKPNLLNDPKFRAIVAQIVVVVLFVSLLAYIGNNAAENMEKIGIKAGFDFLGLQAGFMPTSPNFNITGFDVNTDTHMDVFWLGLVNTLLIAVIGIISATIVGFIFGVLRLSSNPLVNFVAAAYIEGTRNIPLLLQILVWYFGVLLALPVVKNSLNMGDLVFLNNRYLVAPAPVFEDGFGFVVAGFVIGIIATFFMARWARIRQEKTGEQFPVFFTALGLIFGLPILVLLATGVPLTWDIPALKGFNFVGGVQITSQLTALFLALTFYTGAFIAENVRSGIQAVSHGQTEASSALGLRPNRTMSLIVIPQAMRVIVPPVTSQYLNLAKNSSLAIAIGYPDIVNVFMGISLNQTGKAIEIIGMTMGVYLTISLIISMFMNWYNKRVALVER